MSTTAFGLAMLRSFLAASSSIMAFGASAGPNDDFERGLERYEESRYSEAFADFRLAARGGHGRAQEVLGFMYLHGSKLYGVAVPESRREAAHWFEQAARAGRPVAQYMTCVLVDRPAGDRMTCAAGAYQAAVALMRR